MKPGHYIVTSEREHFGPFPSRLDALDEADNKLKLDPDHYAIRHLDENGDRVSFCAPPPYMTDPQTAGALAKLHRMLGKSDSAEELEAFANGGPPPMAVLRQWRSSARGSCHERR